MPRIRGLTFRETMSGAFALSEPDPSSGERAGQAAHTALTLRLTITIPDIRAFTHESPHAAHLRADVESSVLGGTIRSDDGVVRLFAPADEHHRVMYYGMLIKHAGRPRYLVGVKHVDGRSLLAMWSETTTLYTRLHDGPDAQSPVIGAGVLRLGPLDLLRTLPTMRPTPSVTDVTALAQFGGFFVSELWDAYVARRPVAGANVRGV